MARLDDFHLRLHGLHLRHRQVAAVGEREEGGLDDDGHDQDRHAEVADKFEDEIDEPEQRLGDEVEPAPVDHQIEVLDAQRLLVVVDGLRFLGAGEDMGRRCGAGAGGDRRGLLEKVALVGLGALADR